MAFGLDLDGVSLTHKNQSGDTVRSNSMSGGQCGVSGMNYLPPVKAVVLTPTEKQSGHSYSCSSKIQSRLLQLLKMDHRQ